MNFLVYVHLSSRLKCFFFIRDLWWWWLCYWSSGACRVFFRRAPSCCCCCCCSCSCPSALSPALRPASVPSPHSPSHRDTGVVRRGSRWADLEQFNSRPWASVTHLRMDLYLQRRTRKQLVNPFSLRPLICSYLLQQPKKSQGIFSSLLPIDPALRKSALLSKHYWSPPSQRQALAPVYKGTGWIEISFPTTCSCYFYPFSIVENMGWQAATRRESISAWLRGEGRDRGWTGETGLSRLLQLFHIDPYRHYCFKDHAWNDEGLVLFHTAPH